MIAYRADAGGSGSGGDGRSGDVPAGADDPAGHGEIPLTIEEYERLPEESLYRLEMVRGRIVREPRPGARHGQVVTRVGSALHRFVEDAGLGVVLIDVGVILATDPPTVRGPDVAFVAAENVPEDGPPTGFLERAPDLAVEVVSPSNRWRELEEKAFAYLDAGARVVWLMDPSPRRVVVLRGPGRRRELSEPDALDGGDLLPGFRLPLAELFAG